jgi:F0F1-type ATP synthase delta subunit
LAKILNELEIEYAKKEGKVLAKIYSEKALTDAEINEIKYKLSLRAVPLLSKERSGPALSKVKRSRMGEVKSFSRRGNLSDQSDNIIISNIIKNNWAGIEVVIDDKVIDLSTKGKIEKLRQALSS